jgi:Pentapeptide repeats (9 copies)
VTFSRCYNSLKGFTFQGITFNQCSFARVNFEKINFSRCKFIRIDLTRASFKECFFSDTAFIDCDPYYTSFERTEVDPASFKRCFREHAEWNKALLLFSNLRRSLKEMGETRSSRTAEYYFRVWQRRRLYHRWHFKRISGFRAWFASLCLGALTGYGERPIYLAAWAFAVVTIMALIYMRWLPYALDCVNCRFSDYWYYSFKVFFAQGLSTGFQSIPLSAVQVLEFGSGLVMVSLLIGSVARKLSP